MDEEAVFAFVALLAIVWLLTPVVRAWSGRISAGGNRSAMSQEELQRRYDELSEGMVGLQRDVADLIERVEFAERLLSKQRDADRLPRGG